MAFKIGFIGAGGIAGVHAEILAEDSRVRLFSIFDSNAARAAAMSQRYSATPAPSIEAVLETCDAVYICTPNTTHSAMASQVLAAGKHLFCEKPFALNLEAARQLRDLAAKTNVVFQVGHNRRFAPVYKTLKEAIQSGSLSPLSVHSKMNRGELLNPSWVWDARLTGGFLYETPVHMFDLMQFFFGDAQWVYVAARAHEHHELDDFSILIGFKSGLCATMMTFAHASWHFPFERFEVSGHHSTYETFEMERIAFTQGLKSKSTVYDFGPLSQSEKWGYVEEDRRFVDALEGKSPPAVTAEDGFRSVELIEACYKSAHNGQKVSLPL